MTDRTNDPNPSTPDSPTRAWTPPAYETPGPGEAPTPVQAVTPPRTGRSRARWVVALGLVALLVGGSVGAAMLLTGKAPDATVLGWVPSGSVAYGEMRLDLPGDQRAKLGEFLSKFPGFDDRANLDTKIDETLDRLLSEGTNGEQTFTRDVKPWFGGEVAFSVGALPDVAGLSDPTGAAMADSIRALLVVSVKDAALGRTWFADLIEEADAPTTTEPYKDTELILSTPIEGGPTAAFGIAGGKVALLGDVASVKAAIDTAGTAGLAADPNVRAAVDASTEDHVGFLYLHVKRYLSWAVDLGGSMEGQVGVPAVGMSDSLLAMVPDWMAMDLRFEGDALVTAAVAPHVDAVPGPTENRRSSLAEHLPASTVALFQANDQGTTLIDTLKLYRTEPSFAEFYPMLDQAMDLVGGAPAALGWIGDTGIVLNRTGDGVEGGVVIVPADAEAGRRLMTQLRTFVALGGAEAGVTVRDEEHAGATITVIDVGDAAQLMGLFTGMATEAPFTPEGRVEIASVVTDGVAVLGSPDFVKRILDTQAASSLASDDRFEALVARAGGSGTSLGFVDIASIRELVEGLALAELSAEAKATYERDFKPFIAPFDAIVTSTALGRGIDSSKLIITVK
jgi:hypothetical protein